MKIFLLPLILMNLFSIYSNATSSPILPRPPSTYDIIEAIAKTDPAHPENEKFLDEWKFQAYNIDDDGRSSSPSYFEKADITGGARIRLPREMFDRPLVIKAYNPIYGDDKTFEIFIPAYCYDKAIWIVGPFENALWSYYKNAAKVGAESWNPSQVDCLTWLLRTQPLLGTTEIIDELNNISYRHMFDNNVLFDAFKKHTELLMPTRPAICMAERRHNGGSMDKGEEAPFWTIDAAQGFYSLDDKYDRDEILIKQNGIVNEICGLNIAQGGRLNINGHQFNPKKTFVLDDEGFNGLIHQEKNINDAGGLTKMDVSIYNVRHSNGYELRDERYDDSCAITSLIEFKNKDDDEQDLNEGTGVIFNDLFNQGHDVSVYLTSSGDRVVDDKDVWAILHQSDTAKVISVELLGHRKGKLKDLLKLELNGDDLFIGLDSDYELNEKEIDGEKAYLNYTIVAWDLWNVSQNIIHCYEASDIWTRQYFDVNQFHNIDPFLAAEYAVRSQCFSNSKSQQRWQSGEAGLFSINSHKSVIPNIAVNAGWLAPKTRYEVYIQKFDERVFKGPRTIVNSDDIGQLLISLPHIVEGDRVKLKSMDGHRDHCLVLTCVPEFVGFAGYPGIPYVPLPNVIIPPALVPILPIEPQPVNEVPAPMLPFEPCEG